MLLRLVHCLQLTDLHRHLLDDHALITVVQSVLLLVVLSFEELFQFAEVPLGAGAVCLNLLKFTLQLCAALLIFLQLAADTLHLLKTLDVDGLFDAIRLLQLSHPPRQLDDFALLALELVQAFDTVGADALLQVCCRLAGLISFGLQRSHLRGV